MNNDLQFSVVTVCYNSEKTVERTILSVLNQKNCIVQYIIIDGKSTDGTMDIVNKYRDKISVVVSEADNGIYDAMNKAIPYCKGDIVAFMNSDDWYAENALEKVALAFREKEADVFVGDYFNVSNRGIKRKNQGHIGVRDIRVGIMFCHQSMFCRKTMFDEIGLFDTKYKISADYDWLLRAIISGKKIAHINDSVCFFSLGGVSDRFELLRVQEVYEIAMKNITEQDNALVSRIEMRREYSLKSLKLDKIVAEKKWTEISDSIKKFSEGREIYLFGLSTYTEFVIEMCLAQNIVIKGIVDNCAEQWMKSCKNIKVLSPKCLTDKEVKILIISVRYIPEIEEQLMELGYEKGVDYTNILDMFAVK